MDLSSYKFHRRNTLGGRFAEPVFEVEPDLVVVAEIVFFDHFLNH
jgi:hypothetical protein